MLRLSLIMARMLSQLLGAKEPLFTTSLRNLETASGHPDIDVRLVAEIISKMRAVTTSLGLDPNDTTPPELYAALLDTIKQHDELLLGALECTRNSSTDEILAKIKNEIDSLKLARNCWAIKHSTLKKLLKSKPPKAVMKYLGYKSIDSLLKRERIDELCAAAQILESKRWQASFTSSYKSLTASDFETRDVHVAVLDTKRWGKAAQNYLLRQHHNVVLVREAGLVAILPLPVKNLPGLALVAFPLILHYVSEIRTYSTFTKLQHVTPNFGEIVARALADEHTASITMADQQVHWRVVHHYFGKTSPKQHPELFEPHVQPEDLHWRHAEEIMTKVVPAIKFWQGLDYVGVMDGKKVLSLNLLDLAISYCNNLPYGKQATYHLSSALWDELFMRYMDEPPLKEQVLEQLDNHMTETEQLMVEAYEFS
ncbi:MAG: hypothetical protein JWS12_704 [Candidatus Saccharibacteria bacterium]|nr:hypothetical protein [Candidatus Saccharibacteria bacterium]